LDPLCTHELSGLLRTQNMKELPAATYSAPKLTTRDATSLTYDVVHSRRLEAGRLL
jgi:hypothetical protein